MASSSMHDRVHHVVIGDGENTIAFADSEINDFDKADLALINEDGGVLETNAAAATAGGSDLPVSIANFFGKSHLKSAPSFRRSEVKAAKAQSFVDAVEQTIQFGTFADGISVQDDTAYKMTIVFKDSHRTEENRQTRDQYSITTPSSGSTPYHLLTRLASFVNAPSRGTDYRFLANKVRAEVLADPADFTTDFAGTVGQTVKVRYHSRKVVTEADQSGILAVGNFVMLNGGIYKVTEISANGEVFFIDRPFGGIGGTILEPERTISVVVGDTGFGIKDANLSTEPANLVFQLKTKDVERNELFDQYEWYSIDASIVEGAGEDPLNVEVSNTAAIPGHGVYPRVQDDEQANMGRRGFTNHRLFPYDTPTRLAEKDCGYHQITLKIEREGKMAIEAVRQMPITINIYIKNGSQGGTNPQADNSSNNFLHVLNGYLGTSLTVTDV